MKPFSESSEKNKESILFVLKQYLNNVESVLEIGSGTGQHAVFFAKHFPKLMWFTSDQSEYLAGIKMWIKEAGLSNIDGPLLLDVNQDNWQIDKIDSVFSANTVHIMDWMSVKKMFFGIGNILKKEGVFCLYGPFNYAGEFSSESNARFDIWLKQRDILSGVRDFEALNHIAESAGLDFIDDIKMPANNRILVWKKS